jgi:ATP adenylyltransferase
MMGPCGEVEVTLCKQGKGCQSDDRASVRGVVMDILWAPWRLNYILVAKDKPADSCFVCDALGASDDRENLVVLRTERSVVMLNRFPYNNGHLLIAPQAHKGQLEQLTDEEMLDLMRCLRRMTTVLRAVLEPHGFNIGVNLGRTAGAGLPGHFHWHMVPRWEGDTNFMPVLAETKVINQSLQALYDLLRTQLAAGAGAQAPPDNRRSASNNSIAGS